MELSQTGLTSWGHRYVWIFGEGVTLYHDESGGRRCLVTHLNTSSGLPFEDEYMDDKPVVFSQSQRCEWVSLCYDFLRAERDIYTRVLDALHWYLSEQISDMLTETHDKRVITSTEYQILYCGAQNAVTVDLRVPDKDLDIIIYEGVANIIDLWLCKFLRTAGFELEKEGAL